jgi:cAMP phosphodiesterase
MPAELPRLFPCSNRKIETVLLTHHHFDHIRDLVTLAANNSYYWRKQLVVCAPRYTLDIVTTSLLDGKMYTNFLEYPSKEKPTVVLEAIEPSSRRIIAGHDVLAVPVKHSVPTVGYQVTSLDVQHSNELSAGVFYTGDTTGGISDCWQHVSPQLLITEVAGPDKYEDWLKKAGHFCPRLLNLNLTPPLQAGTGSNRYDFGWKPENVTILWWHSDKGGR